MKILKIENKDGFSSSKYMQNYEDSGEVYSDVTAVPVIKHRSFNHIVPVNKYNILTGYSYLLKSSLHIAAKHIIMDSIQDSLIKVSMKRFVSYFGNADELDKHPGMMHSYLHSMSNKLLGKASGCCASDQEGASHQEENINAIETNSPPVGEQHACKNGLCATHMPTYCVVSGGNDDSESTDRDDTHSEYGSTHSEYGSTHSEYGSTHSEYGSTYSGYGSAGSEYDSTEHDSADTEENSDNVSVHTEESHYLEHETEQGESSPREIVATPIEEQIEPLPQKDTTESSYSLFELLNNIVENFHNFKYKSLTYEEAKMIAIFILPSHEYVASTIEYMIKKGEYFSRIASFEAFYISDNVRNDGTDPEHNDFIKNCYDYMKNINLDSFLQKIAVQGSYFSSISLENIMGNNFYKNFKNEFISHSLFKLFATLAFPLYRYGAEYDIRNPYLEKVIPALEWVGTFFGIAPLEVVYLSNNIDSGIINILEESFGLNYKHLNDTDPDHYKFMKDYDDYMEHIDGFIHFIDYVDLFKQFYYATASSLALHQVVEILPRIILYLNTNYHEHGPRDVSILQSMVTSSIGVVSIIYFAGTSYFPASNTLEAAKEQFLYITGYGEEKEQAQGHEEAQLFNHSECIYQCFENNEAMSLNCYGYTSELFDN